MNISMNSTAYEECTGTDISHSEAFGYVSYKTLHHENDVVVTAVEADFSVFCIQRFSDKQKIENFIEEINIVAEVQPQADGILFGNIYLVRYTQDNKWYRGIIVCQEGLNYKVKYVDYGNCDVVSSSRIKDCPPSLNAKEVFPFALQCSLWNLKPCSGDQWPKEVVSVFVDLCNSSKQIGVYIYDTVECDAEKASYPKHLVDVRFIPSLEGVSDDPLLSLRDVLLFLELGNSEEFIASQTKVSPLTSSFGSRSCFAPVVTLSSMFVNVNLLHCVSPFEFTLKIESFAKSLKFVTAEMCQLYDTMDASSKVAWKIFAPKNGMMCAAKDSTRNIWYRARINSLMPGSRVRVIYVDRGVEADVHWTQLMKIPDRLLKVPAQAVSCKLSYVSPSQAIPNDCDSSVIDTFRKLLDSNSDSLKASFNKYNEGVYEVSLCFKRNVNKYDVATLLMDADIVSPHQDIINIGRIDPRSYIHTQDPFLPSSGRSLKLLNPLRKSTQLMTSAPESEMISGAKTQVSKVKSLYHSIQVLQVTSPSLIHVRFVSQQKPFNEFQDILLQKMKLTKESKEEFHPSINKMCIVEFGNNYPYFARAKILDQINSGYKVLLVDCGGLMDVSVGRLMAAPAQILSQSSLAVAVALADVEPPCGNKSWPASSIDFLKNVVEENSDIYMIKSRPSCKDTLFWNLKILPVEIGMIRQFSVGPFEPSSFEYVSFKSLLLDEGLALPRRSSESNQNVPHAKLNQRMEAGLNSSIEYIHSIDNLLLEDRESEPHERSPKSTHNPSVYGSVSSQCQLQDAEQQQKTDEALDKVAEFVAMHCEKPEEILDDPHPPQPPLEQEFEGLVTNVKEDGVICLHPLSCEPLLNQMKMINGYKFGSSELSDNDLCWQIGSYVTAKYHLDNDWYRAKILIRENKSEIRVEFVDYGNEELVSLHDIRNTDLFPEIPVQCYKCTLAGLVPVDFRGWIRKTLDILHTIVVMNTYKVIVTNSVEDKVPEVTLKPVCATQLELCDILVNKMRICTFLNAEEDEIEGREADQIFECDDVGSVSETALGGAHESP